MSFVNSLGVELDRESLSIGTREDPAEQEPRGAQAPLEFRENSESFTISRGSVSCEIDRGTGLIVRIRDGAKTRIAGGPHLMILPLNGQGGLQMKGVEPEYPPFTAPCAGWKASAVSSERTDEGLRVRVDGRNDDAAGTYWISLDARGRLRVDYRFTLSKDVDPRQTGMVFDLPRAMDSISWKRRAPWTCYPEDHIGRPEGAASAFPRSVLSGPAGPRVEPGWPWSGDCNKLGSNDFRSTKFNIVSAGLRDKEGDGVVVLGRGHQHVRAFVEDPFVRVAVLDYANAGAEGYFRLQASKWAKPLKKGDAVAGRIELQMVGEKSGRTGEQEPAAADGKR